MEEKESHYRGGRSDEERGADELHSERVRAGRRTYFFDVKVTRSNDCYLTITESKKKTTGDGVFYEKHKIFLYQEDFKKFQEALRASFLFVESEFPQKEGQSAGRPQEE